MNGNLAEAITLTCLGNEYLKKGELKKEFLEDRMFQICQNLSFGILKPKKLKIGNHPLEWFKYLKKEGIQKIRLFQGPLKRKDMPARILAAFQGGDLWMMEAIHAKGSDYWIKASEIDFEPRDSDYVKLFTSRQNTNKQFNIKEIKDTFLKVLKEIFEFAKKNNLDHWAGKFEEAQYALNFEDGARLYPSLFPTDNYELINHQLMLAVNFSDVFGGMGSWNDLGMFEDKKEDEAYEKLSDELYKIRNKAIISSVNADCLEV